MGLTVGERKDRMINRLNGFRLEEFGMNRSLNHHVMSEEDR